jgi:hypothetical protein
MTERTTVRLPQPLLARAKRKAAAEGRTLTSLIEEGLELVIGRQRRLLDVKHNNPPVSRAGGGLMPGYNWDELSASVQEAEDREYVERMKRFE